MLPSPAALSFRNPVPPQVRRGEASIRRKSVSEDSFCASHHLLDRTVVDRLQFSTAQLRKLFYVALLPLCAPVGSFEIHGILPNRDVVDTQWRPMISRRQRNGFALVRRNTHHFRIRRGIEFENPQNHHWGRTRKEPIAAACRRQQNT